MPDRICDLCDQRADSSMEGGQFCRAHYDEVWAWKVALDKAATIAAGGPFPQTCPRRNDAPPPVKGPDRWEYGHGLITNEVILSCSYCGSVHPDYFMEKVHEGWYVGPTDKSYKAYLGRPFSQAELAVHRHEWIEGGHIARAMRDTDTTEEDIAAHYEQHEAPLHTHRDIGKFYFQHLSVQQRVDFIELHNAGLMKIGYPGHFYTPPFFCQMT